MNAVEKQLRVQTLRKCVQEDFCHSSYQHFYSTLQALVVSKLQVKAGIREVIMFLGPARIGKTRILESLNREYGHTRESSSGRSKDLVYVRVPEGGSAGSILGAILRAMGEPYQTTVKLDELRHRVRQRFASTGLKVAIFDETQHMVEEGRKTAVRAASDFIKGLIEESPQVTFIFSGIPLAARLREENPQLRGRCDKPIYFVPYGWHSAPEREHFAAAVLAVYETVCTTMDEEPVDALQFVKACYLLGGGCFGFVINFVRSLANALEQDAHASYLQPHHLLLAFEKNSRDTDYSQNPFKDDVEISEKMLLQAWTLVMREHGLQRLIPDGMLIGAA